MKLEVTICHSMLLSMLMMPERFQRAVNSYTCTAPDVEREGFIGYMEVRAEFDIKDLDGFTKLWNDAYVYPSDRAQWYHFIKSGVEKFDKGE